MKALFSLILVTLVYSSFGFTSANKVGTHLVNLEFDSVKFYLNDLEANKKIKTLLFDLASEEKLTNPEYILLFDWLYEVFVDPSKLIDYYQFLEPKAKKENQPDLDYVIFSNLIRDIMLSANDFDSANELHKQLYEYVDSFKKNTELYRKARLILIEHEVILASVNGTPSIIDSLSQLALNESIVLKDTDLIVMSYVMVNQSSIENADLYGSIQAIENALYYENNYSKTTLYQGTLVRLYLDALVYKGDEQTKVDSLFSLLLKDPIQRIASIEFQIRYLKKLKDSSRVEFVNKIGFRSVTDFIDRSLIDAENNLPDIELFDIYQHLSDLSELEGDFKKANKILYKCLSLSRKLFSKDLTASLVKREKQIIKKEKELFIQEENEKIRLYLAGTILSLVILLVILFSWYRVRKQKKIVSKKNQEISLLLKEVHHRVKNNYQTIIGLLNLQLNEIKDTKTIDFLNDLTIRINAMSFIHNSLTEKSELSVNFEDYLRQLAAQLKRIYKREDVQFNYSIENLELDYENAIPVGLIVNELLTNSYKHAGNKNTLIELKTEKVDRRSLLIFHDNGVGMKDNLDLKTTKSLGFRLIRGLVKQINGKMDIQNKNGFHFTLKF